MKIILVCRVYPTHRSGGMPFVVQDRAEALAAAGHTVFVLTTGHPTLQAVTQVTNLVVHHLDCEPHVYSTEFAEGCRAFCERIRPDVVHCDSLDVHRTWWADLPNTTTACTLHGFGWGSFLTQWNLYWLGKTSEEPRFDAPGMLRERKALATFDTVLGISRHEYQMLRHYMCLPQAKLVYNPIPGYFFRSPTAPVKRQDTFLCASISGQGTRLFETAAEAAQLAGVRLSTISNVKRRDMPAVYDGVDALVVPTAYGQGYDLTIAEALARRRPVIVSDVGSAALEAPDTPGLIVTSLGSVAELSAAMRGPLPAVRPGAADKHRPEDHVEAWLNAIC
jgi:glycosyltransferase involved in cell wall biosynthesis